MLETSRVTAKNVFATIQSMSTTITSYGIATNATWPFITIPNYIARGAQLLELSGSNWIAFAPLVRPEQRAAWEEYAVKNQGWLRENFDGSVNTEYVQPPIAPYIWDRSKGFYGPPQPQGDPIGEYYGPFWQITPPLSFTVNMDIFGVPDFDKVFDAMLKADTTVLSYTAGLERETYNSTRDWPFSYISSPIHSSLERGADVVGVFSAVLPWHSYFKAALPDDVGGIYVVVSNNCGQEFSYLVDSNGAVFIGPGDLHDTQYTDMELSIDFNVLEGLDGTAACMYTVHAYPSQEFHESYTTQAPRIYTISVVGIFLATTLAFVLYDCLVQKKDTKVMTSAENTNAIVASLFPAQVRDRLLEDAQQPKEKVTKDNFTDVLEAEKAKLLKHVNHRRIIGPTVFA